MNEPITTRTLKDHTAQEVFDFVCAAVLKQGKPSMQEKSGRCMLRGPGDTKCAFGHVVADNDWSTDLEMALSGYSNLNMHYLGWDGAEHMQLLIELQKAHDQSSDAQGTSMLFTFNERFVEHAKRVAKSHDLNNRVLQ